jgi:hypothetical protein
MRRNLPPGSPPSRSTGVPRDRPGPRPGSVAGEREKARQGTVGARPLHSQQLAAPAIAEIPGRARNRAVSARQRHFARLRARHPRGIRPLLRDDRRRSVLADRHS